MGDSRPIGVFDSGVGGISVLKQAVELLPNEKFIYFGDDANAPYGSKSVKEIKKFTDAGVRFLIDKGIKALLIACNTATSVAIEELREKNPLPIVSMEPALKLAIELPGTGSILVMATPATLTQKRYLELVYALGAVNLVTNLPCEGLADIIERGVWSGKEIDAYLEEKLEPMFSKRFKAVVLGCTHYLFIRPELQKQLDKMPVNPVIVDGNEGTVRQLIRRLDGNGLRSDGPGGVEIYAGSGSNETVEFYKKALNRS